MANHPGLYGQSPVYECIDDDLRETWQPTDITVTAQDVGSALNFDALSKIYARPSFHGPDCPNITVSVVLFFIWERSGLSVSCVSFRNQTRFLPPLVLGMTLMPLFWLATCKNHLYLQLTCLSTAFHTLFYTETDAYHIDRPTTSMGRETLRLAQHYKQ